jgi:hypothetical protein
MADPISILSGVVSLLDVSRRASSGLLALCRDLKNAPELILALSNEVSDINVVLSRMNDSRMAADSASKQNLSFLTTLEYQFDKAKVLLSDLERLLRTLSQEKSRTQRIKWVLRKSNAEELKNQLREVRVKMNETLVSYNV